MKKIFYLLVIFLISIACGNSEKSSAEKKENTSAKTSNQSPCELLSESEIKKALSIPADTETDIKDKDRPFPSCFYKWESITWPYEVMNGYMADYAAELSIILVTDMNKEKYEQAVSYYENGETINDIGDMATYGEKQSQITFLSKGNLVHVHCKTSPDAASNKEKAIKIAKLIVKKL